MSVTLSNLSMSRVSASTSGSTPPAPSGDPYWSSVSLLTETSTVNRKTNNVFLDTSGAGRTITKTGSPAQGSRAPFAIASGVSYNPTTNGGSGYFNGTSDYLAFDTTTLAGDFTMECWFNQTAKSSNYVPIMSGSTGTYNFPLILDYQGSGKIGYYLTSGQNAATASSVFSLNTWYHLAMVRSGSTITVYLNGTSILTASGVSTSIMVDTVAGWSGAAGYLFNGYMSSVRVVNGTAVYTSAFTPSTQSLPATQSANAYGSPSAAIASGTQLLLSFTNAGIYDAAAKNDMITVGGTQVTVDDYKFSPTSALFDGSGNITIPASSNYAFGTGDFTIEFWFNTTSGNIQTLYDQRDAFPSVQPAIYTQSGQLVYAMAGNTEAIIVGAAITANVWYFVAVSRSGTSTKMFINGTQVGSTYTAADNIGTPSLPILVGANRAGYRLGGGIQDLRVTKGVARYTANFSAPTAPFLTY